MKIAIVGGGPAGISAALAALSKKNKVTIIEKAGRVGGKIPITGNGRCNISNEDLSLENYSFKLDDIKVINDILNFLDINKLLDFLNCIGILTTTEEGRIYPMSGRADQVRESLEQYLIENDVEIITNAEVYDIQKNNADSEFEISYKLHVGDEFIKHSANYDRVVLCTGSPAGLKREKDNNSIYLAEKCNLQNEAFSPALVPLVCDYTYDKTLAGVRVKCTLFNEHLSEKGELQFTEYGISGIPAMQMSLFLDKVREGQSEVVYANFIDNLTENQLQDWYILNKFKAHTSIHTILSGIINPKIAYSIIVHFGIDPDTPIKQVEPQICKNIFELLKKYPFVVVGFKDMNSAQVCMGGVDYSSLSAGLEALDMPGLFVAGEMLNSAGKCGGFNLHFAFASGYRAGTGAMKI